MYDTYKQLVSTKISVNTLKAKKEINVLDGDKQTIQEKNGTTSIMEIRLRALVTRLQTMKSSTMIAIAIMFGLLIVVHVKQADYENRVNEKEENNIRANKFARGGSDEQASDENTTSEAIQSTSTAPDTGGSGDYDYEENDDGSEHINLSVESNATRANDSVIDSTEDDEIVDEENGDYDNDFDTDIEEDVDDYDYGDDEEDGDTNGIGENNSSTDYENERDDDNGDVPNDEDGDDYHVIEDDRAVARNETEEEMVDKINNAIDDKYESDEQMDDLKIQKFDDDEDIQNVGNDIQPPQSSDQIEMVAPDISDNMVLTNSAQDSLQRSVDSDNTGVALNNEQENVHSSNDANNAQNVQQVYVTEDWNKENIDIQKLAQKYPDTLDDGASTKQSDMYIHRLRSKLKQIGKLDIISNNHCTRRLPTCIIIGVMKSGTEAFSTFLGAHPQIAMQFGYTAMEFFSNTEVYNKGIDWYKSRMMCSNGYQVTMEKSPQYFTSMMAPQRIHSMDKDMKLILIVRDPISRAVSHYLQQQKSNPDRLTAATFEDSVYNRSLKQVIGTSHYIYQSTYSIILRRWMQYFPQRQILVINGDQFKHSPHRILSKAEQFLDIKPYFDENKLVFNEETGFYCLGTSDNLDSCFGGGKGRPHPEIEPEVEMALREYFKPYNEDFNKLTGMSFDW